MGVETIEYYTHRIHGAAIYGIMDPINIHNIPPMLAYIPAPWILWAMLQVLENPILFVRHLDVIKPLLVLKRKLHSGCLNKEMSRPSAG